MHYLDQVDTVVLAVFFNFCMIVSFIFFNQIQIKSGLVGNQLAQAWDTSQHFSIFLCFQVCHMYHTQRRLFWGMLQKRYQLTSVFEYDQY